MRSGEAQAEIGVGVVLTGLVFATSTCLVLACQIDPENPGGYPTHPGFLGGWVQIYTTGWVGITLQITRSGSHPQVT